MSDIQVEGVKLTHVIIKKQRYHVSKFRARLSGEVAEAGSIDR